ncbi:MAG: oligosaccharide flippase family protein [Chloroflexi bacterium]|nr:oligosaccharide flippase family protein [Chloroflexota bacterium]
MTSLRETVQSWKQDKLLHRVVGNSSYLFASNAIGAVLSIVTAGLLGVRDFGVLGIITSFVVNINRLFSFRMSDVVVKYMGEALAREEKDRAAAVVKAAGLVETVTSLAAFGILVLLAPLGAKYIAKDPMTTSLFVLFGVIILANITTETSTGVLRVTNHFRSLAFINLLQSILVAGLIVVAAVRGGSLIEVMWAYLIGKIILGIGPILTALYWIPRTLGKDWWKTSFSHLPPWKEFFRFAVSTNFSGTINIFARDSEVQWIGFFFGPAVAGSFKVALALIGLIIMPIDPFIATTYPEITRAYATRQWERLRSLIKRVTVISFAWTGAVAVGLFLVGRQVLFSNWVVFGHTLHIYKPEYLPAYPILLVILAGYGFANILFWNRSLLLAQGKADEALWITFFAMLAKVGLALLILPHAPYLAEAFILSGYFIVSVGLQTWRGLSLFKRQAVKEPSPLPDPEPVRPLERQLDKGPRPQVRKVFSGFTSPGVNRWDWLAVLTFLAFAGLYFLGRLQANYPVVILTGDGGNIASYAAALDHPDWFKNDPALGDSNNIGIYATIHIPLIRALVRLTGDYGLAYAWLVLPQTFLQLLGFYILGRVLFKNRFWAFLLAFLTAMTVINIGLGEIWGVWQDALPRVTFQSLLPFLLALVLVWKDRPGRWPWLMVFAGLLVYVHPISAPAWGLAVWLSLWLLQPKDWNWRRRVMVMLGLGVLFLAAITPFAVNYLSYRGRDQAADYNTVMTILQAYSPANLLDVPAALGSFLWNMTRSLLLPVALVGFAATWLLKKNDRTSVKVVLLWMAGLFITSTLIPFGERMVEQQLHILPLETELVRCIRYFVPLFLLFWLWPLAELAPRLVNLQARRAVIALGIVLFVLWGATNRPAVRDMLQAVSCFSKARLVCTSPRPIDDLIVALRTQTQPGEGVLFFNEDTAYTSQTLSVRYAALRPLVYTLRDSGILGYSNRSALPGWLATTNQMESLRAMTDPQERLEGLVPLAVSLKADYLVIDFEVAQEILASLPVIVVMQNDGYILLKLR